MNFIKIKDLLKKYKKNFIYSGFFLSFFILSGDFAFAAGEDNGVLKTIIEVIEIILAIISSVLGIVTALVSWFLSPEWYNGSIFGLDEYFKLIWIVISNIVYTIFAIILIIIAFMNIINKGDKWELKQSLPRFVVGVLIVPLSWFFVQFVLSIVAVLTISVMTLPYEIFNGASTNLWGSVSDTAEINTTHILKLGDTTKLDNDVCRAGSEKTNEERVPGAVMMSCNPQSIKAIMEGRVTGTDGGSLNNTSVFGIMSIFTYEIMRVSRLDKIRSEFTVEAIQTIASLLQKSIFDALFVVVYAILMIALLLALVVRGVMIWMYTMFSPIFGLLYFFGKHTEGVGDQKFGVSSFIKLALVPVYVTGALSFGLIFLFVANNSITTDKIDDEGCVISGGVFKFCMQGELSDDVDDTIMMGQGVLGRLIIQVLGLIVLWIGVMAALKSSEVTGKVIAPIEEFGKQVGGLIMKSPMYAPIIPTGKKGGMQSMGSVFQAGKTITSQVGNINQTRGNKLASDLAPGLFGGETGKKYLELLTESNAINERGVKEAWNLKERIFANGSSDDLASNVHSRQALAKTLTSLFRDAKGADQTKSVELIKQLENASSGSEIERLLSELDKVSTGHSQYSVLGGAERIEMANVKDFLGKGESSIKDPGEEKKKALEFSVALGGDTTNITMGYGGMDDTDIYKVKEFEAGDDKFDDLSQNMAKQILSGTLGEEDLDKLSTRLTDPKHYKALEDAVRKAINDEGTYNDTDIKGIIRKVDEAKAAKDEEDKK